MITLKSSETPKVMELTENDHPKLKKLYTEAVQSKKEKLIYKRYGEKIISTVEEVFRVLIELDREKFEGK